MVQAGFYILSGFMFLSILFMLKKAASVDQIYTDRAANTYLIWFVVWIIYISLISAFDVLLNFELPPRLPLLIVAPVMISIILFNWTEFFGKKIIPNVAPSFAIYIQSFRIFVELLIYGAFLNPHYS